MSLRNSGYRFDSYRACQILPIVQRIVHGSSKPAIRVRFPVGSPYALVTQSAEYETFNFGVPGPNPGQCTRKRCHHLTAGYENFNLGMGVRLSLAVPYCRMAGAVPQQPHKLYQEGSTPSSATNRSIAQRLEHSTDNREVAGSNPAAPTIKRMSEQGQTTIIRQLSNVRFLAL